MSVRELWFFRMTVAATTNALFHRLLSCRIVHSVLLSALLASVVLADSRPDPSARTCSAPLRDSPLVRLPTLDPPANSAGSPPGDYSQLELRIQQLEQQLRNLQFSLGPNDTAAIERTSWDSVEQAGYQTPNMSTRHQSWGSRRSRYPTIAWGGFLQIDSGSISQDAASKAAVGNFDTRTGLRRVRLNVFGNVQPNLSYLIDVDFAASGHPSFRDVMFTTHNVDLLQNFRIGYYQQPFGLDAMTSGRELIFLERLLPFAFDPFRQTGLGCYGNACDKSATWALSGYRFPTNDFGVSVGESGGWALASRLTAQLIDNRGGEQMVHVGLNYSVGNPGNNIVRYSIAPGFFVTDPVDSDTSGSVPAIVDTGDIPTNNFNLFGAELAAQFGSLNFQSEVKGSAVDQRGGPKLGFWGAYAQLSWVLTGEVHPYDEERGTFRRVIPFTDGTVGHPLRGAWEIAVGVAHIDLNDQQVEGGTAQTAIIGINRYLSQYVKLQFNLIRAHTNDPIFGGTDLTLVAGRAQAEF
jgi:phosphate-selective porin OprO and OprP